MFSLLTKVGSQCKGGGNPTDEKVSGPVANSGLRKVGRTSDSKMAQGRKYAHEEKRIPASLIISLY